MSRDHCAGDLHAQRSWREPHRPSDSPCPRALAEAWLCFLRACAAGLRTRWPWPPQPPRAARICFSCCLSRPNEQCCDQIGAPQWPRLGLGLRARLKCISQLRQHFPPLHHFHLLPRARERQEGRESVARATRTSHVHDDHHEEQRAEQSGRGRWRRCTLRSEGRLAGAGSGPSRPVNAGQARPSHGDDIVPA